MFLSPLLSPPLLPLPLPKDGSSWLINFQTFSNGAMFVLFPPLFLFSFNHLLPPLFLLFIYLNLLLIPSSFLSPYYYYYSPSSRSTFPFPFFFFFCHSHIRFLLILTFSALNLLPPLPIPPFNTFPFPPICCPSFSYPPSIR